MAGKPVKEIMYDLSMGLIIDLSPKVSAQLMEMSKEISQREKEIERLNKDGAMAELKMLENKRVLIAFTKLDEESKKRANEELRKEISLVIQKGKLTEPEQNYAKAKGDILAFERVQEIKDLSDDNQKRLNKAYATVALQDEQKASGKIAEENAKTEQRAIAKSIAGCNTKQEAARATIQIEIEAQRQAEERIKAEGKEFDDNMKKKEEAMKNLAEFDEKMRISSLDGEARKQAQLLANYERQKAEIEAMHEKQLLYEEDNMAIKEEQYGRLLDMEVTYQAEKDAISAEFAEMAAQRRQQEDEAARAMAEQRKREEEELRDLKIQASADTLGNMAQVFEGNRKYAALYKTSAIGEATINAIQSVLKTMAGTPFPWNIALAASQAAVAGVQVSKIASAKMYRGGMIPGMNTLVMANEQGQEAILSVRGVRAAGGAAGVNALNSGASSNYSYDNSRTNTIVINTSIMTQKAYRDEIEPVLRNAARRR